MNIILKEIIKKFISRSKTVFNKKNIGLKSYQYLKFKLYPKNYQANFKTTFFKRPIKFTSPFWFLHSIKEIFIDEVYKLKDDKRPIQIIDCGANIGLSVLYFKSRNINANIIAFEADPFIFSLLKHNIEVYNYKGIELINAVVWKEDTTLHFSSEGSVGGKIESLETSKSVQISALRLKKYLNQKIHFLKIDIEGAEYEVLEDCKELLENVENMFIEYHCLQKEEQKLHEILQWVNDAGFKYYIKEAWNNMSYPFMKIYNDYYQMQLNIFCYRQ